MISPEVQHGILIGFWVLLVLVNSVLLCKLCPVFDEDPPTWRKAIFIVLAVGGCAYLAFDRGALSWWIGGGGG